MKTIILNSSNYVSGSYNTYTYTLPIATKFDDGDLVGLASCSLYNSTFNITSARGNNTFSIIWNADFTVTYSATISDGYYSISDLNYFIQSFCITNLLYVTDSNGDYVYFVELLTNAPRYAVQLNIFSLPTSAQATTLGYTRPSGASWNYPAAQKSPQLVVSSALGNILGFDAGTYPPSSATLSPLSYLSTKSPTVSPVDSYVMTCNLINSSLSIPNNVFYSIALTVGLGSLISVSPAQIVFNDIASNIYNKITIQFYDQLFNPLILNDYNLVLTLAIKRKGE